MRFIPGFFEMNEPFCSELESSKHFVCANDNNSDNNHSFFVCMLFVQREKKANFFANDFLFKAEMERFNERTNQNEKRWPKVKKNKQLTTFFLRTLNNSGTLQFGKHKEIDTPSL